jgi:uncharacterized protein (DUF58 family)
MATQDVAEILKKVQRIQIVANRSVNDLLAGQYKSVFRGRGMEFDEVREYQPGDDVRTIDWNVTARTGTGNAFIKRFVEERELTVLFVVDVSASGMFGSGDRSKLDLVIEVAALLMFSALKNNDKVGLVTFCDEALDFFPPRKGKSNVLHLIRQLVGAEPVPRPTDLSAVLEFVSRVQRRQAVVFLISDFLTSLNSRSIAACGRRHDLIAITVADPRETDLPNVGLITLADPETGHMVELDTRSARVRDLFQTHARRRCEAVSEQLKRLGIDELDIHTNEDYLIGLKRFFRMREKRFR